MATSHYFNNFSGVRTSEQAVLEDLVVESIKIMGHNCWYVPREGFNAADYLYGENPQSKFQKAYLMEFYLANVEGYEGDGDFFSKFGLEIRDTSNFIVSRRTFERYVPSAMAIRPREGDLIFVPLMNKIFEIKFVEEELMFFSIGNRNPYIYELRCELFRYSNEEISTGVDVIDKVESDVSYTISLTLNNGTGNYNIGEPVFQGANLNVATASAVVKNWNPSTKDILLINIKGDFSSSANLIGHTSNTRYNVSTTDILGDYNNYDMFENRQLQTEANGYIDFSESNPFGTP